MTAVFLVAFVSPEHHPPPLVWSVLFIAVLDAVTVAALLAMSGNGAGWNDRHKVAWISGLLFFFVVIAALKDLEGFEGGSVVGIATAYALWKLWRRVGRPRLAAEPG